jgi:hypothetical protein
MGVVHGSDHDLKVASRTLSDAERQIKQLLVAAVGLAVAGIVLFVLGRVTAALCTIVGIIVALATAGLIRGSAQRLLTELVAQGDAFSLAPVRSHAQRLVAQRGRLARGLKLVLESVNAHATAMPVCPDRVIRYAGRFEALARAFADKNQPISPVAAAVCARLLWEPAASPLYNDHLPVDRLERILGVIETGVWDSPSGVRA